MKRSTTIFYAALLLCLLSGALTVFLIYQYYTVLQQRKADALIFGRQQASEMQRRLDAELKAQMDVADSIANDLSSGALLYPKLADRLREAYTNKPDIYAVGAAFEPNRYKAGITLFGPNYQKNAAGDFERKQLEESFNYTDQNDSGNLWYFQTIQSGQANWYVYYDRAAAITVVRYAAPFFVTDAQTEGRVAVGMVYIDHTVETIKEFIRSIDVGQEGYTTLVSSDGKLVIHPKLTLLGKSIAEVSRQFNLPALETEHARAALGEDFENVGDELLTQEHVWRFYKPLLAKGWYATIVVKQNANLPTAEFTIRALMQIAWGAMAFVFFLIAVGTHVERASLRRLWSLSISTALILLAGIAWTWYVVNNNPLRNLTENVLVNPANVEAILSPVDQTALQFSRDLPTRIPTGILIKTIQVDPSGASVSGYIWQKYPSDLPDSVTRGVRFPDDLSGATISEVYRFTSGNTQTIGWFFIANLKQSFDLSKYPLDQANVQIKIWPRELNHNLVFVPDFVSYEFMAPSEKPGLADTLRMAGWKINRSYFSYVQENFNADLGNAVVLQRNLVPSLAFNVNATRILLSPLIAYCITAIVVSSMLFGIQLVNIETPYNALSNASALFFVVAITHVGLRSALNASGVVYLEYIFITQYIYILGGAVNGMLYYSNKTGEGWIHYEHNLIPKIGYWPALLSILMIISMIIFYPAGALNATTSNLRVAATATPGAATTATVTPPAVTPILVTPSGAATQMVPTQLISINADSVTLRYPIYANPATLDPSLSNRYDSTEQIGNLFMGLTRLDPVSLEVKPSLATAWTPSADGLVWTFQLRTDIPWVEFRPNQDGGGGEVSQVTDFQNQPLFVTANDVVYGIRRALTLKNPSAQLLFNIQNAEDVFKGTLPPEQLGVQAINDSTVVFTLKGPAPYFPELLAYDVSYAVPSWAVDEWADDWTAVGKINTNGPYMLASFEKDKRLQLIKNPLWPEAAQVQVEVVEEPIVQDAQKVVEMYLNNELDTIGNPSEALLKAIKSDASVVPDLTTYTTLCTQYIGFVNTKTPFDDVRVRRAFSAAIDRDFITTQILKDGSKPATVFSPPGVFGAVTDPSAGQGYDPETAQELFQEYLDERGLTKSEFNSAYKLNFGQLSTGDTVNKAIIANWRKVLGVEVSLVTAPNDDLSPYDRKNVPLDKAFNMFQGNWCADYPDQDNFIRFLFNSQNGSNNVRRNCADVLCTEVNPPTRFDELTDAASSITDLDQRREFYAQAEQILAVEEAAYAPIFYGAGTAVNKSWLTRNFPALGAPDFFNWIIDTTTQVKP